MSRPARHYPPSDKATIPTSFDVNVVGLTFASGYPANLHDLERQALEGNVWELELIREPSNPHDANAIIVRVAADMETLGHIPAAVAARLAPEMDAGVAWSVTKWQVLVAFGHESNPGITVTLQASS